MGDQFDLRWHGIETGGRIALSFANTLDWRLRAEPVELLRSYTDLLRFGWSAGAIEKAEADRLRLFARSQPRSAAAALARAVALREAIALLLRAKVLGRALPGDALGVVEAAHLAANRARALVSRGTSARWVWRAKAVEPDRVAWAAALDLVPLLTTSEGDQVRQCVDAECGWFFLDASRNHSRRWCSMKGCGNRNKVRSFYRRAASRP